MNPLAKTGETTRVKKNNRDSNHGVAGNGPTRLRSKSQFKATEGAESAERRKYEHDLNE